MAGKMSKEEREAFLAETHVGVISIAEEGQGPLAVPIWYTYQPGGELCVWTGGTSRKARLLREAGRFSFVVQKDTPPYKYVSVEGPILAIEQVDLERDIRPMAQRYMGREEGDKFADQFSGPDGVEGDIWVRMQPERWRSEDTAE